MTYQTNSAEETQKIASTIAEKFRHGGIIALFGPLGAGKTTFTSGFAQGLGIKARLISPTFILMRQYEIPGNLQGKLFHIDLYRLDNVKDIESLGLSEIFTNPHNIVLIEWADKLGNLLPKEAVKIRLKPLSENGREIEVKE